MALTTTSSSGSQTTTQNPQQVPVGNSFTAAQQGSAVQPGTPSSDLTTSQGALALHSTPLTTVQLTASATASTASSPAKPLHHTHPALVVSSIVLFVLAVVLIWSAARPVKNTSDS